MDIAFFTMERFSPDDILGFCQLTGAGSCGVLFWCFEMREQVESFGGAALAAAWSVAKFHSLAELGSCLR